MRRFDNFVAIDWSGAKSERLKGIAIARCSWGSEAPVLVDPGRRWSRAEVLDWLKTDLPPNSIVGLDLSPGLPFDAEQGFFPGWADSPRDAKALWRLVDELCANDQHMAVSSFVNHPEARRHFRHGKGDCGDLFEAGAGRLRETERRQAQQKLAPSSCFNLVGAAQVGKSSLTGMRILNRLNGDIAIWPFDPLPDRGSVIVEIYTSLAARAANIPQGRSKMLTGAALDEALSALGVDAHAALPRYTDHATDAILTSAWLRHAADDTELWNPRGLEAVRDTEGWTFGVA
ncbi:MAG: hypothetical protein ABIQ43_00950 [Sphingomonas sp.]